MRRAPSTPTRRWRLGYATEAATHCRDYGFGKLGKERLIVPVRPQNLVSVKVAQNIGFTVEKEINYAGFRHIVFARRRSHTSPHA